MRAQQHAACSTRRCSVHARSNRIRAHGTAPCSAAMSPDTDDLKGVGFREKGYTRRRRVIEFSVLFSGQYFIRIIRARTHETVLSGTIRSRTLSLFSSHHAGRRGHRLAPVSFARGVLRGDAR